MLDIQFLSAVVATKMTENLQITTTPSCSPPYQQASCSSIEVESARPRQTKPCSDVLESRAEALPAHLLCAPVALRAVLWYC